MIITRLIGGLGNQMFQYASGQALASKLDCDVKVDISDLVKYKLHNGYELKKVFESNFQIASEDDKDAVLGFCNNFIFKKIISTNIIKLPFRGYAAEPHFHYWKDIQDLQKNVYLDGYWQSEKYFSSIKSKLRKKFTFKRIIDSHNLHLINNIKKTNAVSIHIRRGDYLSNSKANSFFGVCPLSYYHNAVNFMSSNVNDPTFYIFSDDISWAKKNFKIDKPHYFLDHNSGKRNWVDMNLMSLCNHNVIANSSFSWWGAWLNSNPNKIVLYPSKLFNNINIDSSDYCPASWKSIKINQ